MQSCRELGYTMGIWGTRSILSGEPEAECPICERAPCVQPAARGRWEGGATRVYATSVGTQNPRLPAPAAPSPGRAAMPSLLEWGAGWASPAGCRALGSLLHDCETSPAILQKTPLVRPKIPPSLGVGSDGHPGPSDSRSTQPPPHPLQPPQRTGSGLQSGRQRPEPPSWLVLG